MSVYQVAEIVFVIAVIMIAAFITFSFHPYFALTAFILAALSGIFKLIELARR